MFFDFSGLRSSICIILLDIHTFVVAIPVVATVGAHRGAGATLNKNFGSFSPLVLKYFPRMAEY